MKTQENPVGLTKDVGWQFGLRKTFPCSQEYLWDFMFSDKGLKIRLGELDEEVEIRKIEDQKIIAIRADSEKLYE